MIEIHNQHGKVIHRSRNLRGILDHARRVGLWAANAYPQEDGKGMLCVTFADASRCEAQFASYQVLCQWLCARRSWAGARHINGSASPRF
jgi:hypothetical protein